MTANDSQPARDGMVAGAASAEEVADRPVDWHAIDWRAANENVRRLQARIVKATTAGRWGKVHALQRLLTHSFSAKALAVRRVTENQGKRTPGVDGATWDTPTKKATAVRALRQRGYRPRPLRRVYIPKRDGKLRPLGIPTMVDRAMQALYLLALEPIAETTGDRYSFGFRRERSAADAVGYCFNLLAREAMASWVLEGDIRSCFDRISHDWLLAHIPTERAILRKWLKAGYMEGRVVHPTEDGTPQGGIISPVLANMALDGLERLLADRFPKSTRSGQRAKVNLVRYADDFIITGSSRELLEEEVRPLVAQFLGERGLELSDEKTTVTHIDDGFDFLGFNVRKYSGPWGRKLLIKPSPKSVKALLRQCRGIIKKNRADAAGRLVAQLNPVLRGWANYHRHVVSKRVFTAIDSALFAALWRWAVRRHPHKSRRWIKDRYWPPRPGAKWVFHGDVDGRNGDTRPTALHKVAHTPIRRHPLIRVAANPFDPADEVYFEERLGLKMVQSLTGRRTLLYLWRRQNGICPVCDAKITRVTGWHNHHRVMRSHGGPDTADNRVLLHPTCHVQLHQRHTPRGHRVP
ncbi:MAG: group II intron reverse transcriptase/maturase [Chloroflexi bacterium]|nr:group II intron reverse transcriptase/maturase [Chloroflexota bacterium]